MPLERQPDPDNASLTLIRTIWTLNISAHMKQTNPTSKQLLPGKEETQTHLP